MENIPNLEHSENSEFPIVNEPWIVTLYNDVHLENEFSPIVLTVFGISIFYNEEHWEKVSYSISDSNPEMLVKFSHP